MASKENAMLAAAVPLLEAIPATRTPDAVYLVDDPQVKHFGSHTRMMLVHPGDVVITEDTTCEILYEGDFLVTAAAKHKLPELPHASGYAPTFVEKLELVEDVKLALTGKELDGVMVFLAGRNMDIEIDGWAVVQVQLSYRYSEVVS